MESPKLSNRRDIKTPWRILGGEAAVGSVAIGSRKPSQINDRESLLWSTDSSTESAIRLAHLRTGYSMSEHHDFLNPVCLPTTLDLFAVRRVILNALRQQLGVLSGTVLDIGCGYMPYKSLVLGPPSRAEKYIGLDLKGNLYQKPDLEWDGRTIPMEDDSVDFALATEVFEHCPEPELVMREALRVLKPRGLLFFTLPFLWPLHNVPNDEYRYTPFAIERHLRNSGFGEIKLKALGGWDASLAQMIGLWVRRRPMSSHRRAILSRLALPVVRYLAGRDRPPQTFDESSMITGISGSATKPTV